MAAWLEITLSLASFTARKGLKTKLLSMEHKKKLLALESLFPFTSSGQILTLGDIMQSRTTPRGEDRPKDGVT